MSFSSYRNPGTGRGTALSENYFHWRSPLVFISICWLPCLQLCSIPWRATASVSLFQDISQLLDLTGGRENPGLRSGLLQVEAREEVSNWLEEIQWYLWWGRGWSQSWLLGTPVHLLPTVMNRIYYSSTILAQRDFFITLALILCFKSSHNASLQDLTSTFLGTES